MAGSELAGNRDAKSTGEGAIARAGLTGRPYKHVGGMRTTCPPSGSRPINFAHRSASRPGSLAAEARQATAQILVRCTCGDVEFIIPHFSHDIALLGADAVFTAGSSV